VRLEPVEGGPELLGPEDVDTRVDLRELELLRRGVAGLDNPRQPPAAVAHDPPVAAPVGRLEREHGARSLLGAVRVDQCPEQVPGQRRHVAVQDEHVSRGLRERRPSRAHRITRAERFGLDGDHDVRERILCRGRADDHDRVGAGSLDSEDHPVDHPAAEQLVEVLRHGRAHARAEPCGHDDG